MIDKGRGIYMGSWGPANMDVFLSTDWLRDDKGKQVHVLFEEAGDVFAARNDGRRYGKGTDKEINAAMTAGEYKAGDLFLAPLEFLTGRNAGGEFVQQDNLTSFLGTGVLDKMFKLDSKDTKFQRCSLTGTQFQEAICEVLLPSGVVFARPRHEGSRTALLAMSAFPRQG